MGIVGRDESMVLRRVKATNLSTGTLVVWNGRLEHDTVTVQCDEDALSSLEFVDLDEQEYRPRVRAYDTTYEAASPAVTLQGAENVLRAVTVDGGLDLQSDRDQVDALRVEGHSGEFGLRISGTQQTIASATIATIAEIGVLVDGATCGLVRAKVNAASTHNEFGAQITNISVYAVQVNCDESPNDPSMKLDIDICGRGETTQLTYNCNSESPGFTPCEICEECICPPIPTDDDPCTVPAAAWNPDDCDPTMPCTDSNCWPEIGGPDWLPQLEGTCIAPAGTWNVNCRIEYTRNHTLTFPTLNPGDSSSYYVSGDIDCLVEAEAYVYTDDYDGASGDTEIDLYDDFSGDLLGTMIVPAASPSSGPLHIDLPMFPYTLVAPQGPQRIRAELVSVTTPVTTVQVSVVLRLP